LLFDTTASRAFQRAIRTVCEACPEPVERDLPRLRQDQPWHTAFPGYVSSGVARGGWGHPPRLWQDRRFPRGGWGHPPRLWQGRRFARGGWGHPPRLWQDRRLARGGSPFGRLRAGSGPPREMGLHAFASESMAPGFEREIRCMSPELGRKTFPPMPSSNSPALEEKFKGQENVLSAVGRALVKVKRAQAGR